jgi:hypothetical protein
LSSVLWLVAAVSEGGLALYAPVAGERAVLVPMRRGDVLVHHERVVHGSGPNMTDKWRCVLALTSALLGAEGCLSPWVIGHKPD